MTANVNEWIWLKGLEIATFISGLLNLVIKMRSDSFFGSILRCPRKALSSLFSPARRTGDRMICLSWPRCSQAMKSGASRNTAICFVRHPNPMQTPEVAEGEGGCVCSPSAQRRRLVVAPCPFRTPHARFNAVERQTGVAQLGNQRPEEQVGDTPNEQDGRKTLDEFIFGHGLRAHFAE